MAKAQAELDRCQVGDHDYARRSRFLNAVILSCQAVMEYAQRYAALAEKMAAECSDPVRRNELEVIALNCCLLYTSSMIYHPEYKGVRLDIYAEDAKHTHYNVEMQVRRKKALGKRSRYYQMCIRDRIMGNL